MTCTACGGAVVVIIDTKTGKPATIRTQTVVGVIRKPKPTPGQLRHEEYKKAINDPLYETRIPYKEYLQTDWWKFKRSQKLHSTGNKCERCGKRATQVHHKNYKTLWHERHIDLESICGGCHSHEHADVIEMNNHIAHIAKHG